MADRNSVEIGDDYAISKVTNRIGYILFGVYFVLSVIVFINILIAMMASSFEHVLVSQSIIGFDSHVIVFCPFTPDIMLIKKRFSQYAI